MGEHLQFGKYKGRRITEVPSEYLEWLRDSSRTTIEECDAELARRERIESASMSTAERIVSLGFRTLAKETHSDTGTGGVDMDELVNTRDYLRQLLKHAQGEQPKEKPPANGKPYWCDECQAWH